MKEIRHHTNVSGQYPANGNYQADYPTRHDSHWSPLKKYLVLGGVTLALITSGLLLLAFKIALIISGVLLAAAAIIAVYIYLNKKFDD